MLEHGGLRLKEDRSPKGRPGQHGVTLRRSLIVPKRLTHLLEVILFAQNWNSSMVWCGVGFAVDKKITAFSKC